MREVYSGRPNLKRRSSMKEPMRFFMKEVSSMFKKFLEDLFEEFHRSDEYSQALEKFIKRKFEKGRRIHG